MHIFKSFIGLQNNFYKNVEVAACSEGMFITCVWVDTNFRIFFPQKLKIVLCKTFIYNWNAVHYRILIRLIDWILFLSVFSFFSWTILRLKLISLALFNTILKLVGWVVLTEPQKGVSAHIEGTLYRQVHIISILQDL